MCNYYTRIYICVMADVKLTNQMVMDTARRYGEEFDRSQVDKWLKGVNSSKAVRVMLAMMRREALNRGDMVMPDEPEQVNTNDLRLVKPNEKDLAHVEVEIHQLADASGKVLSSVDVMKEDDPEEYGLEEVALANFKYEAPGSRNGWKWDGKQLQVCYKEQVYATREYVEIGGHVSLEGDLIRLDHDGKFVVL